MPIETRNGVSYATHDGVALAGDLYLPAGAGPFPALVGVHGGGWQAGARNAFQFWGPYLAERGYVLFAISYRLAKKGQKMFPQAVNDVLAAVQFVRGSAAEIKVDPGAHRIVRRLRRRPPRVAGRARRRELPGRLSERCACQGQHQGEGAGRGLRRLRPRGDVAALPVAEPAREQHREFHGRRAHGRPEALFRGLVDQLRHVRQQSDRRAAERGNRGRPGQPAGADRCISAAR